MITDSIADFLTRIRNGLAVNHTEVISPYSSMKENLANLLVKEGFLSKVEVLNQNDYKKTLKVTLRYTAGGSSFIVGLKRLSSPGQRLYASAGKIPRVRFGHGITIVSTSKGLMTDKTARTENCGGELICQVW